jgi:hypothetical protein
MSYGACVKFGSVDDVQRALPAEDLPDCGSRRSARVLVPLSYFPQIATLGSGEAFADTRPDCLGHPSGLSA